MYIFNKTADSSYFKVVSLLSTICLQAYSFQSFVVIAKSGGGASQRGKKGFCLLLVFSQLK
jgi:hypothetical protein